VNIENTNAPEIMLSKAFPKTLKVGSKFTPPKVGLSDDTTEVSDIVLAISLHCPDGTFMSVSGSVVLTQKGKYTLTYLALDADNNIAFLDCEFTVV
jgi:hypothetical protein